MVFIIKLFLHFLFSSALKNCPCNFEIRKSKNQKYVSFFLNDPNPSKQKVRIISFKEYFLIEYSKSILQTFSDFLIWHKLPKRP